MLKSPVLDFHLFVALLPASFIVKPFEIVSDQKVMCVQSCVHMVALGTLRRTKTGSQQHHSLSLNALGMTYIKKNCVFKDTDPNMGGRV